MTRTHHRWPPVVVLAGMLCLLMLGGVGVATADTGGRHRATIEKAPVCGAEAPPVKADGTAWRCTFADEFGGTELDRSKWGVVKTADTGYHIGDECYIDRPDVVGVGGGVLSLSVRSTSAPFGCVSRADGSTSYQSQAVAGSVTTMDTFTQTYGRYQIRARFPDAKVTGLHSALWLFPQKISAVWGGTDYGEIDIAEFYTRFPDRVIPYLHYPGGGWLWQQVTNNQCLVTHPEQFHTYTLQWSASEIAIWYDDQLCLRNTNWTPAWPLRHPAPFDKPFALIMTQGKGIGINSSTPQTPLPATTQVDWVRVWQ